MGIIEYQPYFLCICYCIEFCTFFKIQWKKSRQLWWFVAYLNLHGRVSEQNGIDVISMLGTQTAFNLILMHPSEGTINILASEWL